MKTLMQSSMLAIATFMMSLSAFALDLSPEAEMLIGSYSQENCKPAHPEEGCPNIEIRTNGEELVGEGSLFGGDIVDRYSVMISSVTSKGKAIADVDGNPLLLVTLTAGMTGDKSLLRFNPQERSLTDVITKLKLVQDRK